MSFIGQLPSRLLSSIYYVTVTPFVAAFWFFIQIIPARAISVFAPSIGRALLFGRKKKVLENMKQLLRHPEWNEQQWKKLWGRHINHLGSTIVETMHYSKASAGELQTKVTIHGAEQLRACLRKGHGAVILTNHIGNPGAVPLALALAGYHPIFAMNATPIQYLDLKVNQFLQRLGATRVRADGAIALTVEEALHNNGVFAAVIDYSTTPNHTAWVRLGDAELQVSLVPATLALLCGSAIFSAIATPLGAGRYSISLRPLLPNTLESDVREQALHMTVGAIRSMYEALLLDPEFWWRWDFPRIRPAGHESNQRA